MIHGENLILAIDGTMLAASKSCSLSKSSSFIEVASPTDGSWESFVPSKKAWDISSDCLLGTMEAYKTLDAAWKAGTALTIRFFNTEYDENETGTAYIDKLDLKASKGSLAKMSVSLKGSGPLSEYAPIDIPVSFTLAQDAMYYRHDHDGYFSCQPYSNSAKIYYSTVTLTKRTMVLVKPNGNDYIFFSKSSGLRSKAETAQGLTPSDYTYCVYEDKKIWLDAGTWYIVQSAKNFSQNSTYKSLSL